MKKLIALAIVSCFVLSAGIGCSGDTKGTHAGVTQGSAATKMETKHN